MLTGGLPFEAEREQAALYAITTEEPEPITARRAGVPIEIDRIVGKAMAKSADERYQHVDELLVDLRALRSGLSATGKRASGRAVDGKTETASQAVAPVGGQRGLYGGLAAAAAIVVWARLIGWELRAPSRKRSPRRRLCKAFPSRAGPR